MLTPVYQFKAHTSKHGLWYPFFLTGGRASYFCDLSMWEIPTKSGETRNRKKDIIVRDSATIPMIL